MFITYSSCYFTMDNIADENFDIFSLYECGKDKVLGDIGRKFKELREQQGLEKMTVVNYLKIDVCHLNDLEGGKLNGGFDTNKILILCSLYGETIDRIIPYPVMCDERYRELQGQIKNAGLGFVHGTDISEDGKVSHVEHAFVKPEEMRTEVELFIMCKVLDKLWAVG